MDAQQIKAFIDAMAASDLDEMEIRHDGWTLRLSRNPAAGPSPAAVVTAAPDASAPAAQAAPASAPEPVADREVHSPLFGAVHLQQAPGEPPFVQPGETIEAGRLLCIVEAMKVFNEVRAERAGTLAEILVRSGQEVEAGQALMRFA